MLREADALAAWTAVRYPPGKVSGRSGPCAAGQHGTPFAWQPAAIGLAAGRGKTEMAKFLLSKGAKPTSDAVQYARTRGHKDIEKILFDAGAKE